jgi:hypothetical protein
MTRSTTAKRDDGSEIDCEFEIEEHGCPGNGWDEPGEASIVALISAEDAEGNAVDLDDEERFRVEMQIAEAIDSDPHYFDVDD